MRRADGRIAVALVVALSLLTLAGPLLVADIPPLTDYPNHLARYWLIAGGVADPRLAGFYRIDWSAAASNIGVDRLVLLLSPWASGLALGHAALVAAAVLPPAGALALNAAIFGRPTPWQALFPIAAWSTTFLMGFLNFQTGLGLALLFAAIDPLAHPRLPRGAALARLPFGLILGADHLFALLFYAILLAGLALGPAPLRPLDARVTSMRLARAAGAAAWCVVPLAVLGLSGRGLPGAEQSGVGVTHGSISLLIPGKLATLLSALASYNLFQELILAAILVGLVVGLMRARALDGHRGLLLAAAGLLVLAILAPSHAAGASWVDKRFPIMALLCGMAAVTTRRGLPGRTVAWLSAAALALSAGQAAWVGWNWRAMAAPTAAVLRALQAVPPGARLLPLQHEQDTWARLTAPPGRYMFSVGDATYRHFDSLAVPLRHAFTPKLFAARGLQPLGVRGDWKARVEHNGGDLASVNALTRAPRSGEPSYLPGWSEHFDYVLVLNADMADRDGPFHAPSNLTLVRDEGFAQLWRVTPPPRPVG